MKKYKEEKQKEIKSLEEELKKLKKINEEIKNEKEDDIHLNDDIIENLKKDIINEINLKIDEEFKDNINNKIEELNKLNIKQCENLINEQFEKVKKEANDKLDAQLNKTNNIIKEMQNKLKEANNINNIMNNVEENPKPKLTHKLIKRDKKGNLKEDHNIKLYPNNNINRDINDNNNILDSDNDEKIKNENENHNNNKDLKNIDMNVEEDENIDEEDVNKSDASVKNINAHHNNLFNKPYVNQNNLIKMKGANNIEGNNINIDYNYFDHKKKEQPKKPIQNVEMNKNNNNNAIQRKKTNDINLLVFLNTIFFKNQQMTEIKNQIMNENQKETLRKAYFKHINEPKNIVYIYVNNFISRNVLKLFSKQNIPKESLEIVKNNIAEVLECIGMDKNYYKPYYVQEVKKRKKGNRQASVEAAIKFRKEFNTSKDDLNEEVLVNKLMEKDNDIYQVFGEIYG